MEQHSVGIRDAKMHLSRFVRMVKNGVEVILTDRGRPVGKIVPFAPSELSLSQRLRNLEENGIIEPSNGTERTRCPPPISVPNGIAQKFLREDRRNGK